MLDLHNIFDDLAAADCPIEWACDNLVLINRGSAAYVFEHPDDAGFVVRLSDYPDGWFAYAEDTLVLYGEQTPSVHRPSVTAISVIGGVFVGIGERLEEIEDDTPLAAAVESISLALLTKSGLEKADALVPGFLEFRNELDRRLDVRPENFMRRGDTLVFNDPYSALSFERERRMREEFAFDPLKVPVKRPVPRYLS